MSTRANQQYQRFKQHRQELLALIREQSQVLAKLEQKEWLQNVRQLEERVKQDTFKVLVIGEFKTGKSTFINALLGAEVLPSYALPCTALINEVKWGNQPQAVLHYRKSQDGSVKPPIKIPVDKLEEYVVIKDHNKKEEALDSPYEYVELLWPLKLCRDGVEIIDSPGLNENASRQKITLDYLGTVDAVLFVLDCTHLGPSMSEQKTIDTIRGLGHEEILFICNRFDLVRERERDRVRQVGYSKFGALTKREPTKGVFFISALDALEGQLNQNPPQRQQSGVPPLENELATFLTEDKGRIKIQQPVNTLKASIREARRVIPETESLLQQNLSDLERQYAEKQRSWQQLEGQRQHIVSRVEFFRQDIRRQVSLQVQNFCLSLSAQIPTWVNKYPLGRVWPTESSMRKALTEISEDLNRKIEMAFNSWKRQTLTPFVQNRVEYLKRDIDQVAGHFIAQVDQLRYELTQRHVDATDIQISERIPVLERLLANAGGYLKGVDSSAIGGTFGSQEILKSLVPQQIGLAIAGFLLNLTPVGLLTLLLAGGGLQTWILRGTAANKKKATVSQKVGEQLREKRTQWAEEIATQVWKELSDIQEAVDRGLAQELSTMQAMVQSVLTEKRKGQANVNQRVAELKSLRTQVKQIEQRVDLLVRQVAPEETK
jgi:signal recognition particle receptor subunit beta